MYSEFANDKICIEMLEVFAHHGVLAEEQEKGQIFQVNAVLYTDVHRAGLEDNLFYSIDYGQICQFITNWMQENTYQLLEAVAEKMSKALLLKYDRLAAVELEIRKPQAPIPFPFGCGFQYGGQGSLYQRRHPGAFFPSPDQGGKGVGSDSIQTLRGHGSGVFPERGFGD